MEKFEGICNVANKKVTLMCDLDKWPDNKKFKLNTLHQCDNQEYCQLYKDKMCMQAIRSILPNNIIMK